MRRRYHSSNYSTEPSFNPPSPRPSKAGVKARAMERLANELRIAILRLSNPPPTDPTLQPIADAISAARALGVPLTRARDLAMQAPTGVDAPAVLAFILRHYRPS